jgi:hypothetical protein
MMYVVNGKNNVEVDAEEASELTALVLMDDFMSVCDDINRGIARLGQADWSPVLAQDLSRWIEVRDAMKVMLSYYLTKEDYDMFMEDQRVYGNVQ